MVLTHLSKATIPTPLGLMTAIATERGLCVFSFEEQEAFSKSRLDKLFPNPQFGTAFKKTLEHTQEWVKHYFSSKFDKIALPTFDLRGSEFAINAWKKLLNINLGKTLSYGALAKLNQTPNASRAIGRIMGQNPICILIPCHRVIGTNGSLTGYGGGLERKIWLLKHEGLIIENNTVK